MLVLGHPPRNQHLGMSVTEFEEMVEMMLDAEDLA
jgi:hypothetical protein